jgi:nitrous oxidase accessory protein
MPWVLLVGLALTGGARAAVLPVPAQAGVLAEALARAQPGDTLRLGAGVHRGGVTVAVPRLTLAGDHGAVVDAEGEGSVITIAAPDAVVRGLEIRNSGTRLNEMDAGVFINKAGDRARVEGNRLTGNLFGVYLWGPDDALVRSNVIVGRSDLRMSERGNGVSVWNSPGSRVEGNDIRNGRDGIFTQTSQRNVFHGNRLRDLRFGVHYMYTDNSEVSDNVSEGNHVGYALMYSTGLTVTGNHSENDRDHGFALNYANQSIFRSNVVRQGGVKCVFIYNANYNEFRDNWFEGCGIGVHFTAGSEQNVLTGNAFIGNETQVKYVGTRYLDWSHEGRGNYWSDNPAFDLNGDGIADGAFRPNDLVDQVVWTYPLAKLLLNSPAIQVLRWAQSQFPALLPGGVVDSAPLMRPSRVDAGAWG